MKTFCPLFFPKRLFAGRTGPCASSGRGPSRPADTASVRGPAGSRCGVFRSGPLRPPPANARGGAVRRAENAPEQPPPVGIAGAGPGAKRRRGMKIQGPAAASVGICRGMRIIRSRACRSRSSPRPRSLRTLPPSHRYRQEEYGRKNS